MRKSKFSETQIVGTLKVAQGLSSLHQHLMTEAPVSRRCPR